LQNYEINYLCTSGFVPSRFSLFIPFNAEDRVMTTEQFLATLDEIVSERHMLQHPFYLMWNEGTLTRTMLREYAAEYYHQVHFFPTYVSATHSNCEDFEIRQMLLENLLEEEHGQNNHPELWRRFAATLGISKEDLAERKFLPHTRASVRILSELARRKNAAEGIAALYAYESQIPEISTTKIDGLKKYYDLDTPGAIEFFAVHEHADEIHRTVTREALAKMCKSDEQKQAALDAAREAADAFNLLLDGVYTTWCTEKASLN
jgi:pyrroloquinoline-quinone synthase